MLVKMHQEKQDIHVPSLELVLIVETRLELQLIQIFSNVLPKPKIRLVTSTLLGGANTCLGVNLEAAKKFKKKF